MKGGDGQWVARCPAHGDAHQSLSVGIGKDGRVLLKCHAGCTTADIAGAMSLTMKDLFVEPPKQSEKPKVTATYDYRDAAGKLLAQKLRYSDKHFSWRRPDGRGGWIYNRKGVPHSLYVAGQMSSVVYVVEGEKDANNLHEKIGGCAVSGADGAGPGKWRKKYTEQLRNRSVYILCDNDNVGMVYAQEVAAALHGTAKSVKLLDLSTVWPDIPEHGDVSDMISALGAEEAARRLVKLSRETPEWTPGSFEGFEGFEGQLKSENGFCEFCCFCGPDLKKNPHFPAAEFPRVLRNFAVNASASLQVAIDMTSVCVLAVSSLCAQRKFKVHTLGDWHEPVNIYAVIVANPSERKSATISLAVNPVYRYQREENERRRPHVEEYQDKRDMLQRRIESLKKSATSNAKKAKSDSPATAEDIRLLRLEMEDLEKDAIEYISLTADDITMEALVSKMAANNETMALVSSEGGIFNVMSGLYSGGMVNIDIILKAWSGDHVEVNRKGRPPETLLNPSLAILLMTQPRVLEAVMKSTDFAGRGLNARFLYAIPASPVGTRTFNAPSIPQDVIDEYDSLICRLLSIPDTGEPRVIELTDEARDELEKIHNEIEPRLVRDLEPLEDWGGKYVGTVARIAGLLHVCDHVEEAAEIPIPGETMRRAGEIGRYFLAHAICAYQMSGQADDQPTKDAKYILKRLDSTGKTEISKRDLCQLCKERVGLETAEQMEPGLDVLVKRGYIKIEKYPTSQNSQNPQKGGRPSYMIYVNPIYTKMKEGNACVA